jgi:hypothetical protein
LTYIFNEEAYESLEPTLFGELHPYLVQLGIISVPQPVVPARIEVIDLTWIQVELRQLPGGDINAHLKMGDILDFDFNEPEWELSFRLVYDPSNGNFVGNMDLMRAVYDPSTKAMFIQTTGPEVMELPPFAAALTSKAQPKTKVLSGFIGQSRADMTHRRAKWPTGVAKFI